LLVEILLEWEILLGIALPYYSEVVVQPWNPLLLSL